MPGIVGLISKKPRAWAQQQLLRMVDAVRHESFYDTGTWIDESVGVYVGWTVQEKSFSDGMPLRNKRGDICLVFSGDEFSDPETIGRFAGQGGASKCEASSYLIHLSEEDPAFPASLNGLFHGLLTNRTAGIATLFNDRYGMHRVYFHESNDTFYFAAEAKAILAVCPALRTPDLQGVGEFVSCSCVLENRTIFKGIYVLPAGSVWTFRNGSIERKATYFQPSEWEEQSPLGPDAYYLALQEVLSRNLPRYFKGEQPIGIALTGGLDTRVILACRKTSPQSLASYTFSGMFRDSQDVRVARRIARSCEQSHEVIQVGPEFLAAFPHYAERSVYLTEGGVDVYRASDLYVSEKARAIAPVKIVGTYGSEILRRAVMFKPVAPVQGLFNPDFLSYVAQARNTYIDIRREHPVTFAAFRQSPWYHHGILALEQTQLTVRSPYLDNDFVRAAFRAPKMEGPGGDVRLRIIKDGSSELGRIRTDRGIGGDSGRLISAVARGFQEFTFKAEYAYDYGMPQWVSRVDHFFSPLHFERLFLGRHKLLHFRVWYRDALAGYVQEMLLDPLTLSRPYIERKRLEAIVQGHLHGGLNYTTAIHKLLTLELLHRRFFDPQ